MRKVKIQINQKNHGITLIALVITIIVLLILAGVTIATLTGNNGILTRANEASRESEIASVKEQAQLDITNWIAEELKNGRDGTIDEWTDIKTILDTANPDEGNRYYVEVTEDGTLNATGGGVADSVDWSNVQNKPTKISDFTNDSGFQTASDVQGAISTATEGLATEEYVNSKVSTVYKYKGSVANEDALPESPELGDTYNLEDTGANVAWDGTKWDNLGMTIDLTGYVQESDLVAITNQEIDTIVAS